MDVNIGKEMSPLNRSKHSRSFGITNTPVERLISRFRTLSLQTPQNYNDLTKKLDLDKREMYSGTLGLSDFRNKLEQSFSGSFKSSLSSEKTSPLLKSSSVDDETLRKILNKEHRRRKSSNMQILKANINKEGEIDFDNSQEAENVSPAKLDVSEHLELQTEEMENEESILEKSLHEISELYVLLMKSSSNYAKSLPRPQIREITESVFTEVVDEHLKDLVSKTQKCMINESFLLNLEEDISLFANESLDENENALMPRSVTVDKIKSYSASKLNEKTFFERSVLENRSLLEKSKSKSLDEDSFQQREPEAIRDCVDDSISPNISSDLWFTPKTRLSRSHFFPDLANMSTLSIHKLDELGKTELGGGKELDNIELNKLSFLPGLSSSPKSSHSIIDLCNTASTINLSNDESPKSIRSERTVSIYSSDRDSESQSPERKSSVDLSSEENEKSFDVKSSVKEDVDPGIS